MTRLEELSAAQSNAGEALRALAGSAEAERARLLRIGPGGWPEYSQAYYVALSAVEKALSAWALAWAAYSQEQERENRAADPPISSPPSV